MSWHVGVIGGGTMGHGIALTFAMYGYQVNLYEPMERQRQAIGPALADEIALLVDENFFTADAAAKILNRIHVLDGLTETVAGRNYIIEAIPERMDLKQQLFSEMDRLCPTETVFASNTSSLPLDGMMATVSPARREWMMVNHWYNPAHLMPIVELSFFGNMPPKLYERVASLYQSIGKQVVKVLKDVPGLVANRIQQAVAREVFSIMEQKIAAAEDVDRALKFGPAFRYATTGQLEVADFGGLDVWCTVGDNLLKVMDNSQCANALLRQKVKEGKLGIKTGEGFFKYEDEKIADVKREFMRRLVNQLKASRFYV